MLISVLTENYFMWIFLNISAMFWKIDMLLINGLIFFLIFYIWKVIILYKKILTMVWDCVPNLIISVKHQQCVWVRLLRLQKKFSLLITEWNIAFWIQQNVVRNHFMATFFELMILSMWIVTSLRGMPNNLPQVLYNRYPSYQILTLQSQQ